MSPPFNMPVTFLLRDRLKQEDLHRLELEIGVTHDPHEAKLVLGFVKGPIKARNSLESAGLWSEILRVGDGSPEMKMVGSEGEDERSETMSEDAGGSVSGSGSGKRKRKRPSEGDGDGDGVGGSSDTFKVLELRWYEDSVKAGKALPQDGYFIFEGRVIPSPPSKTTTARSASKLTHTPKTTPRARTPPSKSNSSSFPTSGRPRTSPSSHKKAKVRPSQLTHEDTSDHEAALDMPPLPSYLNKTLSCERPTPMTSPNDDFIAQLMIIRHARDLENNEVVGHDFSSKSYSAAIASLKSYQAKVRSLKELNRLPGCGDKIGFLWSEWYHKGEIEEVKEIQKDERLNTLHEFWGIHGVSGVTARKFYEEFGWRDLEDVRENWAKLNRDQQIGLKYYEDFALRIPRSEVAFTESVILAAANSLHPGFQICTVGGYRRGKPDSGDMDFILSHPNPKLTQDFLGSLLDKLRKDEWIVHELTVAFRTSNRGQETLAWRGLDGRRHGSGFDTLDHAFLVWQNPMKEEGSPCRRVDIIISPWKTAGCAVLGWSGGTLFERDLRVWSKRERGWKFDSSGVREVGTGKWVDLEGREGDGDGGVVTLEEKERRVFEGLGLEYREPTLRCTH